MGFQFRKRIKIAPGVSLNLSQSGGSLSFGPRGAKVTVGPRGSRATVSIPGSGIYYTSKISGGSKPKKSSPSRETKPLELGFFERLATPAGEEALLAGFREFAAGNEEAALQQLKKAVHLADGAYLAGFLALKNGDLVGAENYLKTALDKAPELGSHFSKYGIEATTSLEVTGEVSALVGPDLRGVLLGLAEVYQLQGRDREALQCLEQLQRLEPADVVVKLSRAEILFNSRPGDLEAYQEVVSLAAGTENLSPVHTALLLYQAQALRGLGLLEAARETLTNALRRKKDRSEELLRALSYQRALVYQELGQAQRARSELEKLYAQDPSYEDVTCRLGL